MQLIHLFMGALILFSLLLLGVLFFMPDETRSQKKKLRLKLKEMDNQKNWQKTAAGLERKPNGQHRRHQIF